MNNRRFNLAIISCLFLLGYACSSASSSQNTSPKGKLFIIGGGEVPVSMVRQMVDESGISPHHGYGIILPMASSVPDTSAYYAALQFRQQGISDVHTFNFADSTLINTSGKLDSLRNATLVYIPGGVQSRFMQAVHHIPGLCKAIHDAYNRGALIAGSSAGAAVMSKIMITGDQKKYPEYTPTFYHLEDQNLVTEEGLGLIKGVIIDMHFITRGRNNRILSAVMEYPHRIGVGIDESTAIIVHHHKVKVAGISQVLVYRNLSDTSRVNKGGKLSAENIRLDIFASGDTFTIN